jgi:hypothetical protein
MGMLISFQAPAKAWSTNASGQMHWRKRWVLVQAWRDAATLAATQTLLGQRPGFKAPTPAVISIDIPFARNARRDPHNYVGTVCKSIVDGLVRAGLWIDDGPDYVSVNEPRLVIDKDLWVRVTILEREP